MEKEIMTRDNKRWREFIEKLAVTAMQNCSSESDRPIATAILEEMGNVDIPKTMEYFEKHGGYCDCEIVFNVGG